MGKSVVKELSETAETDSVPIDVEPEIAADVAKAPAVPVPVEPVDWLQYMPANMAWEYRPVEGCDELIVTVSPSKSYFMSATPFKRNVLLIIDRSGSYYTLRAKLAVKAIIGLARTAGFRKVFFAGSSKGAYGALLLAGICASLDKRRGYYCLAFSPQTQIHPFNENIGSMPSYQGLVRRAERSAGSRISLERHGDLEFIKGIPNFYATIVYSELFQQDVIEAGRLCAPNIRKYPVPFTMHASSMPITMQGLDEDSVRLRVKQLYRTRSADEDLAATMPDEWEKLVDWIASNKWIPPMMDLVDEMLRVELVA